MKLGEEAAEKPEIYFGNRGFVAKAAAGEGLKLGQVLRVRSKCVRRRIAFVFQRGKKTLGLASHELQATTGSASRVSWVLNPRSIKPARDARARSERALRRRNLSRMGSARSGNRPKAMLVGW